MIRPLKRSLIGYRAEAYARGRSAGAMPDGKRSLNPYPRARVVLRRAWNLGFADARR